MPHIAAPALPRYIREEVKQEEEEKDEEEDDVDDNYEGCGQFFCCRRTR